MITMKDAKLIREALEYALELCENPEQIHGVINVDTAFIKLWADGKLGYNQTTEISKFINKEETAMETDLAKQKQEGFSDTVYVPTGEENKFIKLHAYYDLGGIGINMETTQRGIWLIVTPVDREGGWETSRAYSGYKHLLKPLKRKSQKELNKATAWLNDVKDNLAKAFMANDTSKSLEILRTYGQEGN